MSLLLQTLKCSNCGAPLKAKEKDRILYCEHCGSMSLVTKREVKGVRFNIVAPRGTRTDPVFFIPFWVVNADVNVKKETITGGAIRRSVTNQKKISGNTTFYICASAAMDEADSRGWNMNLTLEPPNTDQTQPDFRNGTRVAMTMDESTAKKNAEFIFLRHETEIPGILQSLDYDFVVRSTEVLYLPVYKSKGEYKLGA